MNEAAAVKRGELRNVDTRRMTEVVQICKSSKILVLGDRLFVNLFGGLDSILHRPSLFLVALLHLFYE
jgi:hypothetical protein